MRSRRPVIMSTSKAVGAWIAAALLAASCSCSSGFASVTPAPGVCSGNKGDVFVDIEDFYFTTAFVTVNQTVEWTNNSRSGQQHSVTFIGVNEPDCGLLNPSGSGLPYRTSRQFYFKGDYPYHCTVHPGMNGVVHVD